MSTLRNVFIVAIALIASACDKSTDSFSVLNTGQQFQQGSSALSNKKIDILWVVDNSSSMTPFQQNLANNFNSFISDFVTKGYDFHIAVTTSDAYLAMSQYNNNNNLSKWKDGVGSTHTGYPVIDAKTPNVITTFQTNALQGANGDGDERVFSSFKTALSNPLNSAFLRPDSFLAVIILSDEDDFSDETRPEGSWVFRGGIPDHDYNDPNLDTVASYKTFLDTLTHSTATQKNYNVSTVSVIDQACLTAHSQQSPSTVMGTRYMQLATDTDGVLADICSSDYSQSLIQIQQKILELSTQFFLTRTPIENTITITVNGTSVPEGATNGWTYDSTANSIVFHGTAVPQAGATINVNFTPDAPTS